MKKIILLSVVIVILVCGCAEINNNSSINNAKISELYTTDESIFSKEELSIHRKISKLNKGASQAQVEEVMGKPYYIHEGNKKETRKKDKNVFPAERSLKTLYYSPQDKSDISYTVCVMLYNDVVESWTEAYKQNKIWIFNEFPRTQYPCEKGSELFNDLRDNVGDGAANASINEKNNLDITSVKSMILVEKREKKTNIKMEYKISIYCFTDDNGDSMIVQKVNGCNLYSSQQDGHFIGAVMEYNGDCLMTDGLKKILEKSPRLRDVLNLGV